MNPSNTRFPVVFLLINGLFMIGYGLYCLLDPEYLEALLGVTANVTNNTEFRAMYGGLQAGLGIYWVTTSLQPKRLECGLLCLTLVLGSLAVSRGLGLFLNGPDSYNSWAFAYEFPALLVSIYCLIKARHASLA